ncbi:hypothetical protein D3C73_1420460 [compost metagenome]
MAMQFSHEGLAKPHDFAVRATSRIEIRPALAAADRHTRQCVLESLFKAKEFDDAHIHGRVETNAPFIGAKGRVELHAEAAVDLYLTRIIDPGHTKDDLAFGLANALDESIIGIIGVFRDDAT